MAQVLERAARGCHVSATNFFRFSHRCATAKIIDGRKIALELQAKIKLDVEEWLDSGHRRPRLTAVLVGRDPASCLYVKNKMIAAQHVGIDCQIIECPESILETDLLKLVSRLNHDPTVDGILVQLPLPGHVSERMICNAVVPQKDVDGFNIFNLGRLCLDMQTMVPCTPLAVVELIRMTGILTKGKFAVVCGRSKNVGMPIAILLHSDGSGDTGGLDATISLCHRHTPRDHLSRLTREADIIVSAAGIPGLITADIVKPGACVIDVGISRVKCATSDKSRLVGDVDFEGVRQVAGFLTPVPGGVGPMTVTMLMRNTLLAAKNEVLKPATTRERSSLLMP